MCLDLVDQLSRIEDPRSTKNKLYPLEEILVLCICAVVSGADGWGGCGVFFPLPRGFPRRTASAG